MNNFNCMITGIGGQGILLASKLLAQTAISKGDYAQTSETIGMAQRGGSVVSHVRISSSAASPNIPLHGADLIIGFEPAEAVRHLNYLKPNGCCIVSSKGICPITTVLRNIRYEPCDMLDFLQQHVTKLIVMDADKLCYKLGSSKVLNMFLLGGALGAGVLNFTQKELIDALHFCLPQRFWLLNERAIEMGMCEIL